jgi:hypothetical protein
MKKYLVSYVSGLTNNVASEGEPPESGWWIVTLLLGQDQPIPTKIELRINVDNIQFVEEL